MTNQAYQYAGGYGTVAIPNAPIIAPRSPATTDIISPNGNPYQLLQGWKNSVTGALYEYAGRGIWIEIVDAGGGGPITTLTGTTGGAIAPVSGNINLLGNGQATFVGTTGTLTLTQTTGGYPITPFVVGPVGKAGYQTIQSAINAANTAGGGIVYIQPGTYTENLILQPKVNLLGAAGSLGDTGYYVDSNYQCAVVVNGTYTLDTQAAPDPTFNTCENIQFSPATGNVITFNTNAGGIIASTLNLINCTLIGTQAGTSIIAIGGFPILNLYNCTLKETTPDTIDLVSLPFADSGQFITLNGFNSYFSVNETSPATIPDGSDIHFYLNDCFYGSMLDLTANTSGFFSIDARNTIFSYTGSGTVPLFNFGNCAGSVAVAGGQYLGGSGGFSSSLVVSTDSFWVISNVYFSNTLIVATNCKDKYINCYFFTGSSPAITMSSATSVTFAGCVVDSSNNPAITGAGAGTLTLGGVDFIGNTTIAGTLTLSGSDVFKAGGLQTIAGTNTAGASPQIVNARQGRVGFTDVIANGAFGTLTLTDSFISSTSVIIGVASCTTVNSGVQVVGIVPGSGSVAFRILNAGSASTATTIFVNFWVLN